MSESGHSCCESHCKPKACSCQPCPTCHGHGFVAYPFFPQTYPTYPNQWIYPYIWCGTGVGGDSITVTNCKADTK